MASRPRHSSRPARESDSMEALKPLVVLALFGTILYGAYSVVQKGPSNAEHPVPGELGDAPAFAPPAVELAPRPQAPAALVPPAPAVPPVAAPAAVPAAIIAAPQLPVAPVPVLPAQPPAAALPQTVAAERPPAVAAAGEAAAPAESPGPPSDAATYLTAQSAPPPGPRDPGPPPVDPAAAARPDRYATLATMPPAPSAMPSSVGPAAAAIGGPSAAFAAAWADAHEKLAAGRYAEALAALSIFHDDPSLGLEESQRLDDLLGQLAGTVIYSQQDLLLPPHVVAPGDTLPAVAMPLGIPWQLLGKINGVADPQGLVPGEHLKVIRGPFDAVVSVSRRRLALQLGGNYAGSFPVVVGRQVLARVGGSISVEEVRRGDLREQAGGGTASATAAIVLADGLVIEAADDPGAAGDDPPATSLVVSDRDLAELLDILGPGSRVLIRQ